MIQIFHTKEQNYKALYLHGSNVKLESKFVHLYVRWSVNSISVLLQIQGCTEYHLTIDIIKKIKLRLPF